MMVTRRDPMTLGVHGAEVIRECMVSKGTYRPDTRRAISFSS